MAVDLRKSESLATKDSKRNPNGDGGERNEEKSPLDVLRSLEGVHVAEADTDQAEKILETARDNLKKKEATADYFKRSLKEALFQQRRSEASLDIESNLCVQQVNISQPVIKEADENKKEPEKNIRSSEDLPRNLELRETDFELKQQGERSQKDVSQQESQRPHKSTKTRPKVGEETEQDSSQSGRSKGRAGKGCDLSSSEQLDFSERGDEDKVESDQLDMQETESFDILEKRKLPPNSDQLDISERNGLEQDTCPSNSDQSGISEKGGSDKLQQTKCPPNPDCLDISDKLEQIKCPALPCQQQFTGVRQRVVYLLRTHLAKMHFHRCSFSFQNLPWEPMSQFFNHLSLNRPLSELITQHFTNKQCKICKV